MLLGGDPGTVLQQKQDGSGSAYEETTDGKDYSKVDTDLVQFAKQILAGAEDVRTKEFEKKGRHYEAPHLVIFNDAVSSKCGNASSETGHFYCGAGRTVYIDLSFFKNRGRQIGADGDFAYAYVIAHEVGHHVQYLLGTLNEAHSAMARYGRDTPQSNQVSVRLGPQADFYAGVWAYNDNKMFGSLEDGDIEEALNAASAIGDDALQKKYQGRVMPDSFTHG